MNDKSKNSEAMEAIDQYLDVLLDTDSNMACEEKTSSSAPLSGSKLYHIDSHPLHKSKNQRDDRHNLERVERLLDDFNNRNSETSATSETDAQPLVNSEAEQPDNLLKTDLQEIDTKVLVEPLLLQPDILEEEFIDEETVDADDTIVESEATEPRHQRVYPRIGGDRH